MKVRDKVRIKDLETLYNSNISIPFGINPDMFQYSGKITTITNIKENIYHPEVYDPTLKADGCLYYLDFGKLWSWSNPMFELVDSDDSTKEVESKSITINFV